MALATSGLAPHRLVMEITESVLIQDAEAAVARLRRLKSFGVCIALDDFGIGYSSLSYLRRFPFDQIKIDRSFINEITDPCAAAIVRAIVGIATQIGASVTAEGVETVAQLKQVQLEGCTDAQGFLISKPLSSKKTAEFIKKKWIDDPGLGRRKAAMGRCRVDVGDNDLASGDRSMAGSSNTNNLLAPMRVTNFL